MSGSGSGPASLINPTSLLLTSHRSKAYKYYLKAKNLRELVNCTYILDDFEALYALINEVGSQSGRLIDAGSPAWPSLLSHH